MTTLDPNTCPREAVEYFRDYANGRYDQRAHLGFIYALDEARLSDDKKSLFVGRPGADGIEFAYREDHAGIWAFYPIEHSWRFVAPDIATLERNWLSGELKV